ncbi:MAG: diguanylate cyclase [Epsilonproteobacteria bacterium]|nr:diguanylate cyclase [Campylobacterota bacterium]
MATKVNDIVKESIKRLQEEKKIFTPSNYIEMFCKVAKEKGIILEDCRKLDKYLEKLDPVIKQEIKNFNVKSIDELFMFLASRLSRSLKTDNAEVLEALYLLVKRVLQSIAVLHNKKARDLANFSLEKLKTKNDVKSLVDLKDKWFDFLTSYDDSFLNKIDAYCVADKSDLEKFVNAIVRCFNSNNEKEIYQKLAPLIIATLSPSIASSIDDELAAISYELRNSPEILATDSIQEDIKKMIKKRMELDKNELKKKFSEVDKMLLEIEKRLMTLIGTSDTSNQNVIKVRDELRDIDFKTDTFEVIQQKLIKIADSLEYETRTLNEKMKENQDIIKKLKLRNEKLEHALLMAKKESKEDFLTKLATRRAIDMELKKVEEAYKRYKIDYSLCFVDIDHFKNINDTYGHDAGDIVLAALGKILKRFTRDVDFVGRYGGEEFLIILPSTNLENAIEFANKIRNIISNFKFMYKNERIKVNVSIGVSERALCRNLEETIKRADEMLYKAKKTGRNKVCPFKDESVS